MFHKLFRTAALAALAVLVTVSVAMAAQPDNYCRPSKDE